ncbi:hypothetical protein ERX37_06230 [Macrococcus hajekii]|uniref:Uncharacterized protein n=1 Tax=Macrococcus hajekii TaxID=198482 RepID=A0A4R6BJC5_9STAP|nr:hypothetical protein [Macrococcus hajekii]TDM01802.1 hypothetical protein ERX37_06230 [Macrococcus hajekii]GGB07601.1 hypothetical protein GCM10007190_14480 [Macrococcus hajekii]
MRYFVTEEWEGPGPVVTFKFKNNQLSNEYYLYVDYTEAIQDIFLKYNRKFFVAGVSHYSNGMIKKILKDLYMYKYPTSIEKILIELQIILKYNLSLAKDIELVIEGV